MIRSTRGGSRTVAADSATHGSGTGASVAGSSGTPRPRRRASPWSGSGTGTPGPVTGSVACSGRIPSHAEKGTGAPARRAAVRHAETSERASPAGTGEEKNHQRTNPLPSTADVIVGEMPIAAAAF